MIASASGSGAYTCAYTEAAYAHLMVITKKVIEQYAHEPGDLSSVAERRAPHSKNKVVTLTVIHVILVAVSQGLVTLPCSDMVCALCTCTPCTPGGSSLAAVTTAGIRALMDCHHRQLEL